MSRIPNSGGSVVPIRNLAIVLGLQICVLSTAFAEPPDLATRKGGVDWPKFLGPTADSVSSEKGILTTWPKTGLKIVWQTKLGLGYGPATISRGRLFHFDASGSKTNRTNMAELTCRNSETGKEIWSFSYKTEYDDYFGYDNGPRCAPLVDGDRVYIYGAEGILHCCRVEDGKPIWKVDTHAEYSVLQNFFGVGSSPVIEGDLIIVAVGGSPAGTPAGVSDFMDRKGNGTALVAFDKYTGKEKYRTSSELAAYSTPVLATVADKRLGLYFARGGLVGFEPSTGKEVFHYPWRAKILESVNASNPLVVGDSVLVSECYGPGSAVVKIKGESVEEVWTDASKGRDKSLKCHWNTPVYCNGYVYGSSGRHTSEAELRCVDFATGKVMWKQKGLTRCSLLMVEGHFVCLCEDGLMLLLKVNPNKFEEVARWDLGEAGLLEYPSWAAPVLSHGLLYVRGKEKLLCVELIPEQK
jgi:outer membrane protein assembly factor BamB